MCLNVFLLRNTAKKYGSFFLYSFSIFLACFFSICAAIAGDYSAGGATAAGGEATAVGNLANANGPWTSAFGYFSRATATYASAYGANSNATASYATAVGVGSQAWGQNSSAFGYDAQARGANSVAIGYNNYAFSTNSMALGARTSASGENSTAIGYGATTTTANQMMFGTSTTTYSAPGITSAVSKAAQTGSTQFVSTDANGNLASSGFGPQDITNLQNGQAILGQTVYSQGVRINSIQKEARQGVAMAAAMSQAPMPSAPGKTSWKFNNAIYKNAAATSLSIAHRLPTKVPVAVTAGVAIGLRNSAIVTGGLQGEF